jgi:hypothetical protein
VGVFSLEFLACFDQGMRLLRKVRPEALFQEMSTVR